MGEGNVTRKEFYDELRYWEVIRIYNGIQRRYRILRETSRQHDYMYLCAHWNKENGPMPKSVYEWSQFPWDPVVNPAWEKWNSEECDKLLKKG